LAQAILARETVHFATCVFFQCFLLVFPKMGSGASASVEQDLKDASDADIVRKLQELGPDELAKIKAAVGDTTKKSAVKLGVIRLDYDYPAAPGDIDHPGSYSYDVFYRVVPGLTFGMCQAGVLTADVEKEFIEAVKHFEAIGVSGITGDCGFMMWFQKLARQHTSTPVFMSSLAHLPAIVAACADNEQIAVMTANGKTLEPMRELVKEECHIDTEDKRLIVVGCEDVPGFEAVALGEKVPVADVMPGMVAKAKKSLEENPQICGFLLECTELPPYSDAIRAATGLPVFDSITCADFYMRTRMDNPLVGLDDWQKDWDGIQEKYKFGQNLTAEDKAKVVNQGAFKAAEATKAASKSGSVGELTVDADYEQASVATLGVLRLDIDYKPHEGDVAHPQSFGYPVYYRKVKGLTYDVCKTGILDEALEKELNEAIKYLSDKGVAGLTCDCGLSMLFSNQARKATKTPVFLSPLAQLPAISSAFSKGEQILIVTGLTAELEPLKPVIRDELNLDPHDARFVILACDELPGFKEYIFSQDKPGKDQVKAGLVSLIRAKRKEHPLIRAVLLEYTALSVFSDGVRCETGLPVFDVFSVCDLFMNGRMDNPLFGLNGWQKSS